MIFNINFTPSAREDLKYFKTYEQRIITDGIRRSLREDANRESGRRKPLRPNELAPWELRLGAYRIFYDFEERARTVKIIAIGFKDHEELYIRGRKVIL